MTELSPAALTLINTGLVTLVSLLIGIAGYFLIRLINEVDGFKDELKNHANETKAELKEQRETVHSMSRQQFHFITEINATVTRLLERYTVFESKADKLETDISNIARNSKVTEERTAEHHEILKKMLDIFKNQDKKIKQTSSEIVKLGQDVLIIKGKKATNDNEG